MKSFTYLGSDWDVGARLCGLFAKSLVNAGLKPSADGDVSFCWGQNRVRDESTIVFDLGYIDRAWDAFKNTGKYYQASIGKLGWLPEVADKERSSRLNVKLKSYSPGGIVCFCGQVPNDQQHGKSEAELLGWFGEVIDDCRLEGSFWRPHPQAPGSRMPKGLKLFEGSKAELLEQASLIITYNSTIGLEALIAGCEVHCSPNAFYGREAFFYPAFDYREKLIDRVAYAQWTPQEIAGGACWKFLRGQLK